MKHDTIIRKIQATEKGTALAEQNMFLLEVVPQANKFEIKQAVEEQFGVHVVTVRTQNYAGKPKSTRTRRRTKRPDWKRAIVTLRAGERIEAI